MKKASRKAVRSRVRYPSKASLREMPELAPDAKLRPNPYAAKIRAAGGYTINIDGEKPRWVPLPAGRPKKDTPSEASTPRSVRLPDSVWAQLQERAKAEGVAVHTLLRGLVADYLAAAGPAKVQARARATKARRARHSA